MIAISEQLQLNPRILHSVDDVNNAQKHVLFEKLMRHFHNQLSGKTIALWGLAFKPRTDDIREAPALTLMRKAAGYGASCTAFDPVANDNARAEMGPAATIVDDMYEALKGADALIISTDWDEFKSPDFNKVKSLMKNPVIFDGRNLYRLHDMQQAGFTYYSVGRAPVKAK